MGKNRDKNGETMSNMVTDDFEHLEARISTTTLSIKSHHRE